MPTEVSVAEGATFTTHETVMVEVATFEQPAGDVAVTI
jgi:hypothetical protein